MLNIWILLRVLFSVILIVNGEKVKKRACIIGAGLSGLISAKYLSEYPDEFETIVFEKNSNVGGLWIYTDSTTVDKHGLPVHSGIYKNLRTNSVKRMLTFPDYPDFGGESSKGSFVKHQDILQYLRNYTDHFKLHQYIRFSTNVIKVKPLPHLRWLIVAQNLNTRQKRKVSCDVAIVCNGFNVKGYIPKIKGIEKFRGRVLHSHAYRRPEDFTNQTVVLLGASYSGLDISADISSAVKKVYLSHRHKKIPGVFLPNLEQVPGVVAAESNKLILSNGTKIQADALIFCTGYHYDFPFLDNSSGIIVDSGKYIRSLYKQVINIQRPTMAVIDVPEPAFHFQNPHAQMQYFRAVLLGKLSLPSHEQMLRESQLPPNVPKSKAHELSDDQVCKYYNDLEVAAGGKAMPWWFAPSYEQLNIIFDVDPLNYKNKTLVVIEKDHYVKFV